MLQSVHDGSIRPVTAIAKSETHPLSATRILAGEFGCDRRVPGVVSWFRDLTELLEAERRH